MEIISQPAFSLLTDWTRLGRGIMRLAVQGQSVGGHVARADRESRAAYGQGRRISPWTLCADPTTSAAEPSHLTRQGERPKAAAFNRIMYF